MRKLILKDINKSFGTKVVLKDFNLELDNKQINCLIGESGRGKSTILNLICGLSKKDSGDIIGASKGSVSYIFQEDRLLPWLTVYDNIKLALTKYYNGVELNRKIDDVLKKVNGEEWKDIYPNKLSGGMRQRVNIARALGKPSDIILMDEPFKSLDYKTKYSIMKEFKKIFEEDKRIVVFVTHDVDECVYFMGKVIVVSGSPLEIKGVFDSELYKHKEKIIDLL